MFLIYLLSNRTVAIRPDTTVYDIPIAREVKVKDPAQQGGDHQIKPKRPTETSALPTKIDSTDNKPEPDKPKISDDGQANTKSGPVDTTGTASGNDGTGGTKKGSGLFEPEGSSSNPASWTEIEPKFVGGEDALQLYLQTRVDFSRAKNAGVSQAKIKVSLVIDPDGNVTNVEAVSHYGYGMEEAVMDVVRKMPKWTPGMNNNKPVYVRLVLPVRYVLE